MKIVIATATYYPQINGVATFSHNLAVGLAGRGNEVVVLCPSLNGKTHEVDADGVRVIYLKSVQIKMYPDQIHAVPDKKKFPWYRHGLRVSVFPKFEVARVLDEFLPDVVHVQVSDPIGLSVVAHARKLGVPVVTTEHSQPEVFTGSLKMPKFLKRGTNGLLAAYFRNRQAKSDFVTMPTEQAIRNLFSEGHEIGVPVAAVSNGVDLSSFRPGKAPEEIYRKYGLSRERLKVLYVGRVDPEKQVGKVIEAFEEANVPGAELIVVGDGTDRARLIEKARKMGLVERVKFLGKVLPPDLYELYKVGDVFATASEIETQGIVLIEAAATGLPLIAVDKGSVTEVCRDGENGVLCRAGDVAGIAEAMRRILSDDKLRQRFGKKSIEVAKEHDFETTLNRFTNIYNRVVKEKTKIK